MAIRYQRRVNLGKGIGLNLSGRSISMSTRTKWGSFGTGGFSILSGIPGLSYRQRYKKGDFITPFLSVAIFLTAGILVICIKIVVLILIVLAQAIAIFSIVCFKVLFILACYLATGLWVCLFLLAKGIKSIAVSLFAIAVSSYIYLRRVVQRRKEQALRIASYPIIDTTLDARSIYVSRRGAQEGPFLLKDIIKSINNGYLSNEDHFWDEQLQKWKPITEIRK